jgi:hypothetical protein
MATEHTVYTAADPDLDDELLEQEGGNDEPQEADDAGIGDEDDDFEDDGDDEEEDEGDDADI